MKLSAFTLAVALSAPAALAETPGEKPQGPAPVWTKTKAVVCDVTAVQNCRSGGCEPAPKLPSFRIDVGKQTICGIVGGACKNELRLGQVGFDRAGTRMAVHVLGAAFVIGIDADGAMNGADVVPGRVVAIQGRCVPG